MAAGNSLNRWLRSANATLKPATDAAASFNTFATFAKTLSQLAGHIGSAAATVFAFVGVVSSGGGQWRLIDVSDMPMSLRVVLLLIIAAAMGWSLGALVSWLSRDRSEARRVLSILTALICSGLLVFSAEWLTQPQRGGILPELQIFVAIGLCVALWVATFQFRIHARGAAKAALETRALSVMTFAFAGVGLVALALMGQT